MAMVAGAHDEAAASAGRSGCAIRLEPGLGEGAVELGRMVAQPAPPRRVVWPAGRDDSPETWTVPEHPQVGQLVDDDRLERFGWGEDEAPRKGETTLARGTPPARALIPDADRDRRDAEGAGVAADLALDLGPGARLEPRFQDGRGRAPVRGRQADDDLVLVDVTDPFDAGAAAARAGGLDPEPVEVAAEADRRAVTKPAPGGERRAIAGMAVKVTAQPRLTLAEEHAYLAFGIHPVPATRGRHGDDDAAVRVDDDAQAA